MAVTTTSINTLDPIPRKRGVIRKVIDAAVMTRFVKLFGLTDEDFEKTESDPVKAVVSTLRGLPAVKQSQLIRKSIGSKMLYNMLKKENAQIKESLAECVEELTVSEIDLIKHLIEQSNELPDMVDPEFAELIQWSEARKQQKQERKREFNEQMKKAIFHE